MPELLTLPTHDIFDVEAGMYDIDIDYIDYKSWFLIEHIKRSSMKLSTLYASKKTDLTATNIDREALDLKGIFDWTDFALKRLDEVYNECSEANWDGYGAEPVSREAYVEARKLLGMIGPSFPMPEVFVEPDGEIAFEWYKERDLLFVISVGGNNIITYAGLFGKKNKTHGTETFTEKLPGFVVQSIHRVFTKEV